MFAIAFSVGALEFSSSKIAVSGAEKKTIIAGGNLETTAINLRQ